MGIVAEGEVSMYGGRSKSKCPEEIFTTVNYKSDEKVALHCLF